MDLVESHLIGVAKVFSIRKMSVVAAMADTRLDETVSRLEMLSD